MDKFVKIRNTGDEPLHLKYNGSYETIPAGGERIFTWDVMVAWMGDPSLEDTPRHQERRDTYNRLCLFHHARGLTGNDPDLLPPIEAYTEDGERIITVLDDPTGETLLIPEDDGTDVSRLQRQIRRLEERLEAKLNEDLVDEPTREWSEDAGDFDYNTGHLDDGELNDDGVYVGDGDGDGLDLPEDTPTQTPMAGPQSGGIPPATPPAPAPRARTRKAPAKKAPSRARKAPAK